MNSLLIITGGMGSGKTSVLSEASDILTMHKISHAAIDVDALGLAYIPSTITNDDAMHNNLRSVCKNYAAAGVTRFLLARAMESQIERELYKEIASADATVVCRVTARLETMQRRVQGREVGISRLQCVARVAELNLILDQARLEDFTVANEKHQLTDVAFEMLVKARWIN